jgi:hypothetical protein
MAAPSPPTPNQESPMHPLLERALCLTVCAAFGLAASASSQERSVYDPWAPRQQEQEPAKQPPLLPNPLDILLEGQNVHPRFAGNPAQQGLGGLPFLTPPGFGAYPGGQFAVPFRDAPAGVATAPMVSRSPNAWPSWLPAASSQGGDEGFTPDVAIVAQTNDYVWVLEPDETAFTPLAYWDRYRVVPAGTTVDVRGGGQFALAFQRGSVLRSLGKARAVLERLDEEVTAVGFEHLSRVVIVAGERPVRARIGRAGSVEAISCRLSIAREGGLVHVSNLGPGQARFDVGDRVLDLPRGFRISVIPDLPSDGPSLELGLRGDLQTSRDGRVLRAVAGAAGGALDWSGARFELPRGANLVVDPLAGSAFPEGRP